MRFFESNDVWIMLFIFSWHTGCIEGNQADAVRIESKGLEMKMMKHLKQTQLEQGSSSAKFGAICAAAICCVSNIMAGTTDHLQMGLDLVDHLLEHQTNGEFVDGIAIAKNHFRIEQMEAVLSGD